MIRGSHPVTFFFEMAIKHIVALVRNASTSSKKTDYQKKTQKRRTQKKRGGRESYYTMLIEKANALNELLNGHPDRLRKIIGTFLHFETISPRPPIVTSSSEENLMSLVKDVLNKHQLPIDENIIGEIGDIHNLISNIYELRPETGLEASKFILSKRGLINES